MEWEGATSDRSQTNWEIKTDNQSRTQLKAEIRELQKEQEKESKGVDYNEIFTQLDSARQTKQPEKQPEKALTPEEKQVQREAVRLEKMTAYQLYAEANQTMPI